MDHRGAAGQRQDRHRSDAGRGRSPGVTDEERQTIAEMMAKGTFGILALQTSDLDATFAQLESRGAEVVQEPTQQPYGVRDCAFRDPAGNLLRINEIS